MRSFMIFVLFITLVKGETSMKMKFKRQLAPVEASPVFNVFPLIFRGVLRDTSRYVFKMLRLQIGKLFRRPLESVQSPIKYPQANNNIPFLPILRFILSQTTRFSRHPTTTTTSTTESSDTSKFTIPPRIIEKPSTSAILSSEDITTSTITTTTTTPLPPTPQTTQQPTPMIVTSNIQIPIPIPIPIPYPFPVQQQGQQMQPTQAQPSFPQFLLPHPIGNMATQIEKMPQEYVQFPPYQTSYDTTLNNYAPDGYYYTAKTPEWEIVTAKSGENRENLQNNSENQVNQEVDNSR